MSFIHLTAFYNSARVLITDAAHNFSLCTGIHASTVHTCSHSCPSQWHVCTTATPTSTEQQFKSTALTNRLTVKVS